MSDSKPTTVGGARFGNASHTFWIAMINGFDSRRSYDFFQPNLQTLPWRKYQCGPWPRHPMEHNEMFEVVYNHIAHMMSKETFSKAWDNTPNEARCVLSILAGVINNKQQTIETMEKTFYSACANYRETIDTMAMQMSLIRERTNEGSDEETYEDWRERMCNKLSEIAPQHFDDFYCTPFDCEWPELASAHNSDPQVLGLINQDFIRRIRRVYVDTFTELDFVLCKTVHNVDGLELNCEVYLVRAKM